MKKDINIILLIINISLLIIILLLLSHMWNYDLNNYNLKYVVYIFIVLMICIFSKKLYYPMSSVTKKGRILLDKIESSSLLNNRNQSEQNKNCYFINLSHELRIPINVISSTCQLVMELNNNKDGIDRDKLNYYMSICRKNSYNLLETINDIIDIAKMKNSNYKINIDTYDIVSIVEDSALTLKDYIEQKGIELIIEPEVEEKYIECDKKQIERCIVNLVGNAYKFTDSGGFIKVFLRDYAEEIQIEVQDNGQGIAKENHESIFGRFNQVYDSNVSNTNGSGLGLAITKQIIEKHHGSIKVESELGKGSSFIITLPIKYI
ncbi:MAG TPA: hypothetical protein DG753_05205 [Clostridium sp.]|nr:hypothetical protein [Clostridium sp.]